MPIRLRRRGPFPRLACLLPLAALALAACGSGPIPGQTLSGPGPGATGPAAGGCSASTAPTTVTIDATSNLKFSPATACLKAGGTVTWKNNGSVYHTTTDLASLAAVASDAALPKGAAGWNHSLLPGASWSLALKIPGVYKYFCIPHESLGMLGQITVVGSTTPP